MSESLYERLGGTEGITKIASDAVDLHFVNKSIATRFENSKMSIDQLKNGAATFLLWELVDHQFTRVRIC